MIALTENPNETELWDVLRDRVGRHGGDALVVVAGGAARGPAGVLVRVPLLPRVAAADPGLFMGAASSKRVNLS